MSTENKNKNNQLNQQEKNDNSNTIKYTTEQIQQILDILDSIPLTGFVNHQKMTAIVGILNTPFQYKNS